MAESKPPADVKERFANAEAQAKLACAHLKNKPAHQKGPHDHNQCVTNKKFEALSREERKK